MQQYITYDEQFVPSASGFNNTGVICWCNSILQSLLCCSALNKTLLANENEFTNRFAIAYIELIKAMLQNKDTLRGSSIVLVEFIQRLRERQMVFSIGTSQECVHEAYTLFIDLFESPRVNNLFSANYMYMIECSTCHKTVSSMRDNAFYIEMFDSDTNSITTEKEFRDWILFHTTEHDEYTCEHCGQKMTKFLRKEQLRMLREIVVLVFNKFYAKYTKWFPKVLEFPALPKPNVLKYRQVAQIEHSGGMNGGHYYAVGQRNGQEYQFNDSLVGSAQLAPTDGTFMVFYHMV